MGNITFNPAGPEKSATRNLTQPQEQDMAEIDRHTKREQWLTENTGALDDYNRRIESRGTFSDGLRRF